MNWHMKCSILYRLCCSMRLQVSDDEKITLSWPLYTCGSRSPTPSMSAQVGHSSLYRFLVRNTCRLKLFLRGTHACNVGPFDLDNRLRVFSWYFGCVNLSLARTASRFSRSFQVSTHSWNLRTNPTSHSCGSFRYCTFRRRDTNCRVESHS